jgi:hypothetical protein
VIGNARTLVVFRIGSHDAELLAPEFRPMDPAGLADQEPFTAWLRRGIGRDRIFFAEPMLHDSRHRRDYPRAEPAAVQPIAWGDRAPTPNPLLKPQRIQPLPVLRHQLVATQYLSRAGQ